MAAGADSVGFALLGISRATEVTGGLITLGYGYLQDDPEELSRAIGASNFFLFFSLCLIGATSVSFPLLFPDAGSANTAWLWANVALWTARSVYQAVAPQGTQVKGLSQSMLAGFIVTDLLFIFSALVSTLHGWAWLSQDIIRGYLIRYEEPFTWGRIPVSADRGENQGARRLARRDALAPPRSHQES